MKPSLVMTLAALGLLCACGQPEGRGGLTAEEERQLDNAAAMLDETASPDSLAANEQALDALDTEAGAQAEDANAQ